MTPSDALEQAILRGTIDRGRRWPKRPGFVIESLPKETREVLAKLTSEHTLAMRWYNVDGPEEQARKAASKLKMEFDKKAKVRKCR